MSLDQQFNSINEKLQQLVKQYNRLQKENERLKTELQEARSKDMAHQEKIDALVQQVSILKVSHSNPDDKDRKEFEKKLNLYIKEIDRCISYLSQ
jgi:chromosome segregation ATPase